MKIKTSELTGAALDWAVANCDDVHVHFVRGALRYGPSQFSDEDQYSPSNDWSQGGPIIERELIAIDSDGKVWCASSNDKPLAFYGPTMLIAAMRCYVASKLGDEVDVPDEVVA